MGVYHYCSTIYFGSIGQQTREIGTNVTFLGITQRWTVLGPVEQRAGALWWTTITSAGQSHTADTPAR